jgi:acyl-CoA synthetase (AMP-forming)/AMP-acid ligase II
MSDIALATKATSDDAALAREHPLTLFGLDALVAGAARPRPERVALQDDGGDTTSLSYGQLDAAIGAFLTRLADFDFLRGERVLLCCAPQAYSLVAATALIAAGLEPVFAPLRLSSEALVRAAQNVSAQAIMAPARFAGLALEDTLLEVAAQASSVRLLATLGPDTIDGAVDFSARALREQFSPQHALRDGWTSGARASVGVADATGAVAFQSQGALLGAALGLVRKTRAAATTPVVSLVSPASFGGFVAGPLAALLASAPLAFHAPFDAARFVALLDKLGPVRLVAPRSALPDLSRAGLLTSGIVRHVIAIAGDDAANDFIAEPEACPIIEFGDDGASDEPRAPQPHAEHVPSAQGAPDFETEAPMPMRHIVSC